MSNDKREGPLRHFRIDRRSVLTSIATGAGAAAFALPAAAAAAAHHHHAATRPAEAAAEAASPTGLVFLDQHAFDTLSALSEQIVPGARAARVPEFLDRLLAVESLETQKRFIQSLGTFEGEARAAHGKPWKSLTSAESNALLTKLSTLPDGDHTRGVFDGFKGAIAEAYYATEPGMKELGYNGNFAFVPPPAACA